MTMNMKKAVSYLLAVAALFLGARLVAQVTCTLTSGSFGENFTTTTYKDVQNTAIYGWTPALGQTAPLELPRLGANFAVTKPGSLGAHIYVTDAGDFNGDGYPDLGCRSWRRAGGTIPASASSLRARGRFTAGPIICPSMSGTRRGRSTSTASTSWPGNPIICCTTRCTASRVACCG